jgi:hypothetical protein
MTLGQRRPSRSAFACTITIMIAGVLLLFVVILGHHGVQEIARERAALLTTQAELILLSARDWSHSHSEQIRDLGRVELPLEGMLPPMATGQLELRCTDSGDDSPLVECQLKITQGQRTIARRAHWLAR